MKQYVTSISKSSTLFFIFLVFFNFTLFSQEKGLHDSKDKCLEDRIGVDCKNYNHKLSYSFYGNIALETFYDSRRILGDRQDQYVLTPLPKRFDRRCFDINDIDQLGMLAIKVYTGVDIVGPKIGRTDSSAHIEAKFTGFSDGTVRLFRINKGYFKLDWRRTFMLIGHMYHPISREDPLAGYAYYPLTLSSGHGRGYDPFDYVAQIRVNHRYKNFEFIFSLFKHYLFPDSRRVSLGIVFQDFLPATHRAVFPDMFFQASAFVGPHVFAAGINWHAEVTRLETDKCFKTNEQITSITPFVLAILRVKNFICKTRFLYVENGRFLDIIGGYAVKQVNPATDEREIVNLRALNWWTDLIYQWGDRVEPGLFIGVTKNIGASTKIIKSYKDCEGKCINLLDIPYGFTNIDYAFTISPRVRFRFGPLMVGAEIEYLRTAFAARGFECCGWEKDFDDRGRVIHTRPVSNTRFLITTRYFF